MNDMHICPKGLIVRNLVLLIGLHHMLNLAEAKIGPSRAWASIPSVLLDESADCSIAKWRWRFCLWDSSRGFGRAVAVQIQKPDYEGANPIKWTGNTGGTCPWTEKLFHRQLEQWIFGAPKKNPLFQRWLMRIFTSSSRKQFFPKQWILQHMINCSAQFFTKSKCLRLLATAAMRNKFYLTSKYRKDQSTSLQTEGSPKEWNPFTISRSEYFSNAKTISNQGHEWCCSLLDVTCISCVHDAPAYYFVRRGCRGGISIVSGICTWLSRDWRRRDIHSRTRSMCGHTCN